VAEIRRIKVQGQTQAKSSQDPISTNKKKKLDTVVNACHPNYSGNKNRKIEVQACHNINMRPYLKKN
jgi:hypothetical protein